MTKPIIQTENISYTYPDGTSAIRDINITINSGERVAIVGSNGAGKSTLFSHFNGITKPTSGLIKIDDQPMSYKKDDLMKIRQKVGLVFQNPDDQLFAPTVIEDVAFGPMNLGLSDKEVEQRIEEALKLVGMNGFEKKAPHHLSGGQKKRVAIAGILAMKPEIMVLDEPTTGLDPKGVDQIMKILYMLNQEDMSIIIASHDVEMVTQFADKVFVLHDGEIIGQGTPDEIFNDHKILKKAHLKPPKAAELLNLLKNDGYNLDVKLTVDGAYHEILHAIGIDAYHNLLHIVKNQIQHELLHKFGEDYYHELLHVLEKNQKNNQIPEKSMNEKKIYK